MSDEKTMRMVTNLDRAAIEEKLGEVRGLAQTSGLDDLAGMFLEVEGAPRKNIEQRVANALKWLSDKPEHKTLTGLLELVEFNIKNLH